MEENLTSTDCERFGHEWESAICIDCGLRTYLAVPAREMLLDDPEVCPFFGALTFDGLAVTPTDDIYLIVRTGPVRVYFGPDRYGVARAGSIMIAAMRTWQSPPRDEMFPAIMLWLASCWQITQSEISSAGGDTESALDRLPGHLTEWQALSTGLEAARVPARAEVLQGNAVSAVSGGVYGGPYDNCR